MIAGRLALVLTTALVLQIGLVSQLRVDGAAADLLLCLTIASGLVAGERRGAVTGFCCGVAVDLVLVSRPFGLSALAWAITGYVVGRYQASTVRASRRLPVLIALVATPGAVLLYVLLARVLGGVDLIGPGFATTIAVMSVANALLVLPVRIVMRWAWAEEPSTRVWAR